MATAWVRLDFDLAPDAEDRVTLELYARGLPGWEIAEDDAGARLRLWALPEDAPALSAALDALEGCRLRDRRAEVDAAWTEGWAPERVGRFVVASEGAPRPALADGELLVLLPPALAFGGGEHPTTRLCLRALPELVSPGDRVLDVGCGSGVLSVASARLGAREVVATDIDPTARRATARAARASEVAQVEVVEDLEGVAGAFDLVLANILAPTLVELADALKARRCDGGQILLSGVRAEAADVVAEAYAPLLELERSEEGGWVRLRLGAAQGEIRSAP